MPAGALGWHHYTRDPPEKRHARLPGQPARLREVAAIKRHLWLPGRRHRSALNGFRIGRVTTGCELCNLLDANSVTTVNGTLIAAPTAHGVARAAVNPDGAS